mmetsp:Transcript_22446/g.39654  ORF Transcript_22446/g.39654 Transcript_22446/m.39654 type:complete len:132 (+) Transcript_22446:2358-2753(+)
MNVYWNLIFPQLPWKILRYSLNGNVGHTWNTASCSRLQTPGRFQGGVARGKYRPKATARCAAAIQQFQVMQGPARRPIEDTESLDQWRFQVRLEAIQNASLAWDWIHCRCNHHKIRILPTAGITLLRFERH